MSSFKRVLALGILTLAWPSVSEAAEPPSLARASEQAGIAEGALDYGELRSSSLGGPPSAVSIERRGLRLHGLRVRGGFETARVDGLGQARVLASRYPEAAPQLRPDQARLSLDDARRLLWPQLRADQRDAATRRSSADGLDELPGELVYLLVLGRPLLAWEIETPMGLGSREDPTPSRQRVWISAATGRVLEAEELVFAANQAEVFEFNPQHTPDPITVTLTNLDPEPTHWEEGASFDATYLNGTRLRMFNCIDEETGSYAPWRGDDECYPTQVVSADAEGDFFVELPNVTVLADNIDPRDPYAELSMYYHAEKFFSELEARGVEGFPCELSNMVANFHWLEPAPGYPELDFGPYNNAYYSGQCDITKGPTMLFGQGAAVDFGFDGDVVYHELGHGIVGLLTPDGLTTYTRREDAFLRDARAINEAIADYHTLMITERPEMAEYVGFYWPALGRGWIRNSDNDQICPRDMAGQEHNDSEPLSAALWAARRRVGAKFDYIVLDALPMLGNDASMEQISAAMLELAAAERDAGAWTADEYGQLERALEARGLVDCPRVTDTSDLEDLDDPPYLYLANAGNSVSPWWPGPMQYRHVVPDGSDNLTITFQISAKGNSAGQPVSTDLDPQLLVKRSSMSADAAITFDYQLTSQGWSTGEGEDTNEDVDEVTLVSGDWDVIYEPTWVSDDRRQIVIRGLEPGEVLHLSFVNPERSIAVVREIYFSSVPSEQLDLGSDNDLDPAVEDDGSSCACSSDPGRGYDAGLAFGLLLLVGLGRRRVGAR
ncbi:hypothetical protein G6O69_23690 [Pseudenhygromyxa sp. WMMC2535]|uniref:hypothetical protein n=1 Tax=Pseudenhygromyxa sp. WMMC2535 TaxID=2712867 RepID=UPI001552B70B|nr:hypothetical protein [Pseudenhygromyxa sp. WMMC2535]NVB40862.1 hypothetical protein [Pseudenhygromyxa sp. WMMC2535]